MKLPNYIFFTGVPGSRWSGIAQVLESIDGVNTSDRTPARTYSHHSYTGHIGAYFGRGMEFDPRLDKDYIDQAWTDPDGCKLVKSHDWAYQLNDIKKKFPDAWIIMAYRPDMASYGWWHEAGGFQIKYPCYDAYKNSPTMLSEIIEQNSAILEFGMINNCRWEYFSNSWLLEQFGVDVDVDVEVDVRSDILISIVR